MTKIFEKADILEKISDKVKTVDDLFKLPISEFDRELCDFWFNDSLNYEENLERGYLVIDNYSNDIEYFYDAFYLMECCERCKHLVLLEFGERLYFIFDPVAFSIIEDDLLREREELLRDVCEITNALPVIRGFAYPF